MTTFIRPTQRYLPHLQQGDRYWVRFSSCIVLRGITKRMSQSLCSTKYHLKFIGQCWHELCHVGSWLGGHRCRDCCVYRIRHSKISSVHCWRRSSCCSGLGSSPERRGEDLHGVRFPTPCIYDHLRLRFVWRVHCACLSHF